VRHFLSFVRDPESRFVKTIPLCFDHLVLSSRGIWQVVLPRGFFYLLPTWTFTFCYFLCRRWNGFGAGFFGFLSPVPISQYSLSASGLGKHLDSYPFICSYPLLFVWMTFLAADLAKTLAELGKTSFVEVNSRHPAPPRSTRARHHFPFIHRTTHTAAIVFPSLSILGIKSPLSASWEQAKTLCLPDLPVWLFSRYISLIYRQHTPIFPFALAGTIFSLINMFLPCSLATRSCYDFGPFRSVLLRQDTMQD